MFQFSLSTLKGTEIALFDCDLETTFWWVTARTLYLSMFWNLNELFMFFWKNPQQFEISCIELMSTWVPEDRIHSINYCLANQSIPHKISKVHICACARPLDCSMPWVIKKLAGWGAYKEIVHAVHHTGLQINTILLHIYSLVWRGNKLLSQLEHICWWAESFS